MALLIVIEVVALHLSLNTLSAMRAFIAGEGLWSKAQKDAIISLYRYGAFGNERDYREFQTFLKVPASDRIARMELLKPIVNRDIARGGLIGGQNHPDDVDGMITLVDRFRNVSFVRDALDTWAEAEAFIDDIERIGTELHEQVKLAGPGSPPTIALRQQLALFNELVTQKEIAFSSALSEASRAIDVSVRAILSLTVLTIGGLTLLLSFRFSRSLSKGLTELRDVATEVGNGNLSITIPVRSGDDMGQLATALRRMTGNLAAARMDRDDADAKLRQLNEGLEKQVQERTKIIRQRSAQLSLITNALPVLIAQIDRNEIILFGNESLAQARKDGRSEILGKPLRDVLGAEIHATLRAPLAQAFGGSFATCEFSKPGESGTSIYRATFVPEFSEESAGDHAAVGVIILATDVTVYKTIEAELVGAKRAADAANAAKSSFLANMSHEIRTPLSAILGFSELLTSPDLTDHERQNMTEVIKRNGKQLSGLIDDILDLSKIEAGKLDIERSPVLFSDLVGDIRAMLESRASEKGLRLHIYTANQVPKVIVTDSLRLKQILINIIGNAIKFTRQGDISVRIEMVVVDGSNRLAFFVKDTGPGIPEDHVHRLFKAFHQADASTTRRFGGTGLGLALSRKLAHSLGGDVVLAESAPGQGCTFVATIDPGPLALVGHEIHHGEEKPTRVVDSAPSRSLNLNACSILVVDDSQDIQTIIAAYLRQAGAFVETADNGREGVSKATTKSYSIVLMDLQMPLMDGHEAVRTLRGSGYTGKIIAVTAHAMEDERRRCLEGGFNDHLTKPVSREQLLRIVEKHYK